MSDPGTVNEGEPILELDGLVLQPGDAVGPYRFERLIGKGGMAHVLLARNADGQPVALKVLKASRVQTGLPRFRREFHALARLHHPGVIRVYAWGEVANHPYIAMEYVRGRDLYQVIQDLHQAPREDRWRQIERIVIQLAEALAYIHRRGLVHRDLKPSNILVSDEGRCKITDFGIVKDLDPSSDPFVSTTLVGTWAYASPEQISGQPIDHRSDLYSLGILLYVMLTGRRPFVANDMAGYLELHREHDPPRPTELDPEVPPILGEICMKLLRKQPRDRFQSAQQILYLLEQVDPAAQDGAFTDEAVWEPPLVGREAARDLLRDAISALTRGDGGVVLVEGSEGTGKSRLLRAAIEHARLIGIPVYQASLSPAHGAFEGLLRIARDVGRELGDAVPPELNEAIRSFARGRGRFVHGDLRYQLYDGIRDALDELLRAGPHILAVDGLHHAQPPLVALLGYLVRTLVVRDHKPLLVLATARSGEGSPALDGIRSGRELGASPQRIELGPLDLSELRELVEGLLGKGNRAIALAERLHAETEGNPFFVTEFLRALIERGTIRAMGDGGLELQADATEIASQHLDIPPGVRQVVLARLAHLSPDDRRVVEAVAVSARELDLDVLLDVLDEDEDVLLDRVDRLVKQGVLVERRSGVQTLLDFVHRKVGDVVYRDIPDDTRAGWHRRLGAALELRHANNPVAAEVIGEHYRRAGDCGRAWRYLIQAAVRLWERSLLAEAWELVERVSVLEPKARAELPPLEFARARLNLLRVKSDVLFNRGEWSAARDALDALCTAARASGDESLASRCELDLGATLRRLGDEQAGEALVRNVLDQARTRHDRRTIIDALHALAAIAWEKGDLDACERLASEGLVAANRPDLAPARADILLALTAVQASRGQLAAATSGLTEAEGILRGLRHKRQRAIVLCNLAEVLTCQGELAEAVRRADDALGLARDVMFREGEETALRVRAMALLVIGDLASASADLERSLSICLDLGVAEDLVATRYHCGRLAFHNGRPGEATTHLRAALEAARVRDPESYAPAARALLAHVWSLTGAASRAERALEELARTLDRLALPRRTEVQLLMAGAWQALGKPDKALPLVRQVAQVAGTRGFRPWALRARMMLAQIAGGEESIRARSEAADLARALLSSMPAHAGDCFCRQPGMSQLLAMG